VIKLWFLSSHTLNLIFSNGSLTVKMMLNTAGVTVEIIDGRRDDHDRMCKLKRDHMHDTPYIVFTSLEAKVKGMRKIPYRIRPLSNSRTSVGQLHTPIRRIRPSLHHRPSISYRVIKHLQTATCQTHSH
jgi:hypothetical protein